MNDRGGEDQADELGHERCEEPGLEYYVRIPDQTLPANRQRHELSGRRHGKLAAAAPVMHDVPASPRCTAAPQHCRLRTGISISARIKPHMTAPTVLGRSGYAGCWASPAWSPAPAPSDLCPCSGSEASSGSHAARGIAGIGDTSSARRPRGEGAVIPLRTRPAKPTDRAPQELEYELAGELEAEPLGGEPNTGCDAMDQQ
eukprot:SAG31_NODE_5876_length_2279_cov_1.420642_2_plen_201_part_00